jgi:hypothetical protein
VAGGNPYGDHINAMPSQSRFTLADSLSLESGIVILTYRA